MPAVPTGVRELDHKLYRIVHEAESAATVTATALAEKVRAGRHPEFSYRREGRVGMATPATIERYVLYAQAVKLLNDEFQPAVNRATIKSLEPFQQLLGDRALQYLNNSRCTPEEIKKVARRLLEETPPRLPTIANVHKKLKSAPDRRDSSSNRVPRNRARMRTEYSNARPGEDRFIQVVSWRATSRTTTGWTWIRVATCWSRARPSAPGTTRW